VIDPATRQGLARIQLAYDPAIRPGGFASAGIQSGMVDAPVLPESALQADNNGSFVYVIAPGNKAQRRAVTIGLITEGGVTIASGLQGTEKVVLRAGPSSARVRRCSRNWRNREFPSELPQPFGLVHPQPHRADRAVHRPDADGHRRLLADGDPAAAGHRIPHRHRQDQPAGRRPKEIETQITQSRRRSARSPAWIRSAPPLRKA
jgi:hypothetical protein